MSTKEVFVTIIQGKKVTKKTIKAEEKPIEEAEEERNIRQREEG